jgi:hypothetical protein
VLAGLLFSKSMLLTQPAPPNSRKRKTKTAAIATIGTIRDFFCSAKKTP